MRVQVRVHALTSPHAGGAFILTLYEDVLRGASSSKSETLLGCQGKLVGGIRMFAFFRGAAGHSFFAWRALQLPHWCHWVSGCLGRQPSPSSWCSSPHLWSGKVKAGAGNANIPTSVPFVPLRAELPHTANTYLLV